MGFAPQQVKQLTLWEFTCAFAAWARFHGAGSSKDERSVSLERLQELGIE